MGKNLEYSYSNLEMATKSSLRKIITGRLNNLNAVDIQQQSKGFEIDTVKLLKYALEEADKRCFVPYIIEQTSRYPNRKTRMLMVELKSMYHYEKLPVNRFGIKEMTNLIDENNEELEVASAPSGNLDLMIVPGVAFSLDGRRLGHGKGYYDEFLYDWQRRSPNNREPYTMGLALREQLVDDPLALAGQDFTLDEIIVAPDRY